MELMRLQETLLSGLVWLTSWGAYLIFLGVMAFDASREQVEILFEKHPHGLVILLIGGVSLHLGLKRMHGRLVEENLCKAYHSWVEQRDGWRYDPAENKIILRDYGFLYGIPGYSIRSTSDRNRFPCAIHVLAGHWHSHTAQAFTYYSRRVRHYQSGGRRRTKVSHYFLAVTLLRVDYHFPKLYFRSAHWSDRLWKTLGFSVDKSTPFQCLEVKRKVKQRQKTYQIETADPLFAQQFLHLAMMEYLTEQPDIFFEVDRNVLAIYQKGRLKPEIVEMNLDRLCQIYRLIPASWKR